MASCMTESVIASWRDVAVCSHLSRFGSVINVRSKCRALKLKPDVLLLDNASPTKIKVFKNKIRKLKKKPLLEASGGVNLKSVRSYANSGVDRISIGALTHSAVNLDFSLEIR